MKRRSVTAVNQDRNSLCVDRVGLLRSEELLDATDGSVYALEDGHESRLYMKETCNVDM